MYARYNKQRSSNKDDFKFVESACLFGCNNGYIPWLLSRQLPPSQGEPYRWHVAVPSALDNTEEYRGSTLVIDLKPKQKEDNLSLYEVLDVWGFSNAGWTPIMLRLSGLFVDIDPETVDHNEFCVEDKRREGPIYEFIYLAGTVANGKLKQKWVTPPASPTNGALLWPETLKYFVDCIQQCTPSLI
jgi:hypothetical protein